MPNPIKFDHITVDGVTRYVHDNDAVHSGDISSTVTSSGTNPVSGSAVYNFRPTAMSGIFKGVCDTAAGTATKVVTCPEFTENDLVVGAIVFVTFTATNSAAVADIALSVNNTTAKHITYMRNATESNLASAGYLRANMTYRFVYNGTYWVCDTDYDANTNTIGYLLRTSGTSLVA